MNRLFSAKSLVAAAVALGAVGAATAAHARTDVMFSIGFPGAYVQPEPVYVQPQPVYVQPEPVYVQPRPVYVQPQVQYYGNGYGYYHHRHHREWERRGPWGDWDGDGVPNRFDHFPGNPYRR
jgi:hypothetical protein